MGLTGTGVWIDQGGMYRAMVSFKKKKKLFSPLFGHRIKGIRTAFQCDLEGR